MLGEHLAGTVDQQDKLMRFAPCIEPLVWFHSVKMRMDPQRHLKSSRTAGPPDRQPARPPVTRAAECLAEVLRSRDGDPAPRALYPPPTPAPHRSPPLPAP